MDGPRTSAARSLGDALRLAGYTADGVADLLGGPASAALARGESVPARHATTGGSALETLVRLFLLRDELPVARVGAALPLDAAARLGVLRRRGDTVRAALDLRPHHERFYLASDLTSPPDEPARPLGAGYVSGAGGASVTLAELTVRPEVSRALDLGTGCGVQALHLSEHAQTVVATDVLPRALARAELSAALSGVSLQLRAGDLYRPVAGERFDLVVSNPPFVVGGDAAGGHRTYRDGGLPGDELCRRVLAEAPTHLNEDGWCQILANWVHRRGEDWRERVGAWIPPGCDAWVLQRETSDPAAYVSVWLNDAGDVHGREYLRRYDAWLQALARDEVEGVGFGWMTLRRTDAEPATVRIEDWPHPVERPMGAWVQAGFDRMAWLRRRHDAADLARAVVAAADLSQEQIGRPGVEDPESLVLRQTDGPRRAEPVDTATAALVGACDGTLALGPLLDAIAELLDEDPTALRARLAPTLRGLIAEGYLLPVS